MKFLISFKHAFNGILYAIKTESHMRFHLTQVLFVSFFSYLYQISSEKQCILFLTFSLVISLEIINTSIERLCDYSCQKHNELIRVAKDLAAGAVLVSSIFAIFIAFFIFNDIERIIYTVSLIFTTPLYLLIVILLTILSIYFIFFAFKGHERNHKYD